jgi:tetrahydromethanopterin S-methyltransferase subunit C
MSSRQLRYSAISLLAVGAACVFVGIYLFNATPFYRLGMLIGFVGLFVLWWGRNCWVGSNSNR